MSDVNLRYLLPDVAMESFYDMRNSQPPKDRLHYLDVVLEGSVESNATLLQKLYTDIISKSNIDYGQIPDSQGALIKYSGYKLMSESMDKINTLFKGSNYEEITMMNKLHDIIISCRKDYELGYKFNIEIVKIAYCTAVMTLYEMINICILLYTKKLRNQNGIEFDFKTAKKKDLIIYRGAKSIIKCYETNQWTKMMNEFRKDPAFMGIGNTSVATEDFTDTFGTFINYGIEWIKGAPKGVKIVGKVVVGIIAILSGIRIVVYHFYNSACKIKDWSKNQQEFINCMADQDERNGVSTDKVEKERKLSSKLQSLADFIEVRLLKTNSDAKADLNTSDKTNYSTSEFKNIGFGGNVEF